MAPIFPVDAVSEWKVFASEVIDWELELEKYTPSPHAFTLKINFQAVKEFLPDLGNLLSSMEDDAQENLMLEMETIVATEAHRHQLTEHTSFKLIFTHIHKPGSFFRREIDFPDPVRQEDWQDIEVEYEVEQTQGQAQDENEAQDGDQDDDEEYQPDDEPQDDEDNSDQEDGSLGIPSKWESNALGELTSKVVRP